jgi:hypothetical protein
MRNTSSRIPAFNLSCILAILSRTLTAGLVAFNELTIDLERTEICDRLTSKGITAVLLK